MPATKFSKRIPLCLLILLLAALCRPARGQEFRGSVQGTVTDTKNAIVPNATVTLINKATGVTRVATSNATAHYIFELVDPGTYTVKAVAPGFSETSHEEVLVQSRADVTVDAALNVAGTQATVVVESDTNGVEYNTPTVAQTFDEKLVEDTPNLGRNPILLAVLDPAVVDTRPTNNLPFNTWGSNSLQIAGSQNFSNDIQIDGAPIAQGLKSSYVPNTDAVREVQVQSNAVDAEFGHSGGGIISTTLKSGTNAFHGDAFYTGRYPWADAAQDSYTNVRATSRQNMFGFALGNPILKKKLFNFFSFENWRRTDPSTFEATLPTPAEITGDFSGASAPDGSPLVIYDPLTTKTDAAGNVTRTPFPNNIIPPDRIDPNALKILQGLKWTPNRTPDDPSGLNNWAGQSPVMTNYKNWVDKIDYHPRENLTMSAHVGRYSAPAVPENATGSPLYQPSATITAGNSYSGTVTWTLNPTTVIDAGGSYISMDDGVAPFHSVAGLNWSDLYSGQSWVSDLTIPGLGPANTSPRISIHWNGGSSTVFGGPDGYYFTHTEGNAFWAKALKTFHNHALKAGLDHRSEYGNSAVFEGSGFGFYPNSTANTYVNADTSKSGNAYASFLTGALGDPVDPSYDWGEGSFVFQTAATMPISSFWSYFVNDDWKVNKSLTITAGLRYEYEEPWTDPQNRGSRFLDLSKVNADLAAAGPQIPASTEAQIAPLYNGPQLITNGQWIFSDSSHPGMWNSLKNQFLPRLGFAYRLSANSALSGAWARWAQPWVQQNYGNTGSFNDVVYPGFTSDQGPASMIQGVPQVTFSNPFPTTHPLIPSIGKGYGANLNLGGGAEYYNQNRPRTTSDRFDIQYERELPGHFVGKAVYLFVPTRNIGWSSNPNMVNPALSLNPTTGPLLNQQVPNPFYQIEGQNQFPGGLLYQPTVGLGQLLRPFPQYSDLEEDWTPGVSARYQSLGIQVQRTYREGLSVLVAYNYHFEKDQYFYDALDQYNLKWSWQDSNNARHGFTETSTWQLPVGKGRHFLRSMPTLVDYAVGGWQLSHVLTLRSGDFPSFPQYLQIGNPTQDIPHGDYFNPNAFAPIPPYTRRTNQNVYPGVEGPNYFNIDATIDKNFKIGEHATAKLNLTGYNALNTFVPADPNVGNVGSPTFGKSTDQGNTGRVIDMGLKVVF